MPCNKMAFESKKEAKRYQKDRKYLGGNESSTIYIYQCPQCDQYHYTSSSKSDTRRIKRNMRKKQ